MQILNSHCLKSQKGKKKIFLLQEWPAILSDENKTVGSRIRTWVPTSFNLNRAILIIFGQVCHLFSFLFLSLVNTFRTFQIIYFRPNFDEFCIVLIEREKNIQQLTIFNYCIRKKSLKPIKHVFLKILFSFRVFWKYRAGTKT